MIVRENTESLYFGCEFEQGKPETAELIADIKRLNGKTVRPDSGITIKAISITGTKADRQVCLRVRPQTWPQEGHLGS